MTTTAPLSDSSRSAVHLTVFGGMHLRADDTEVDIGPPRQRAILAMLLAARGQTVTAGALTEALWKEDAPASAANQIHRHVGNLRRALEPGLAPRELGRFILPSGTGYLLRTHDLESDLERFFEGVERSRSAKLPEERHLAAVGALVLAAAPAFAELPAEVLSAPLFARIRRDRLSLCPAVVDAVRAGAATADEVLPAVERLAEEDPLDESVQASLMRLLHLGGRRSDALEAFERTRRLLAENLGIDPGPELRAAQLDILTQDDAATGRSRADAPRELPPAIPGFVERIDIRPLLAEATELALQGAGSIAVLSGMGGVGKTTLAVNWATSVRDQFPDGQLYLNLLGYDSNRTPLSAEDGLTQLLEQLGSTRSAESASERSRHYRQLVAGARMILLLDNARDAEQVRPLLSGAPHCLTIVTSRNRLAGLVVREGARSIPLRRWSAEESRELLVGRLGRQRIDDEPTAVDSIIAACAGLPLALAIAAAWSGLQPESTMPVLAEQLAGSTRILDRLDASEDSDLRATFEWSYRALDAEPARMFRHLAAHPGPQMSITSLASCADRTLTETRSLVTALIAANMATPITADRIELHDLLRAYADELLDESGERNAADRQIIEHYVRSTREAFLHFGRAPSVELEFSTTERESIERFSSIEDALAWYVRERAVLAAMIRRASTLQLDRQSALIALDWRPMNQMRESAADSLDVCTVAFHAARRSHDDVLIAELARDVGAKHFRIGDFAIAEELILEALHIFESAGDAVGEANTYRNLTQNAYRTEDLAKGLDFARRSVEAARRSGRGDVLAWSLIALGDMTGRAGNLRESIEVITEAMKEVTASDLGYLTSTLHVGMAMTYGDLDDFENARRWALSAREVTPSNDPSVDFEIAVELARSGAVLGLVDEVRSALATCDEIIAMYGPNLGDLPPADVERVRDRIATARAWLSEQQ